MKGFDFGSPAVLHLGAGSPRAAAALAVALAAAVAAAAPAAGAQTPVRLAVDQGAENRLAADRQVEAETAHLRASARTGVLESAPRPEAARRAFAAAAESLARAPGGTCFGGFLEDHPARAPAERSTVLVVAKDRAGQTMASGSGFVVRDSADESGLNRLVTVRHLAELRRLDPLEARLRSIRAEAAYGSAGLPDAGAVAAVLEGEIAPADRAHLPRAAARIAAGGALAPADREGLSRLLGVAPFARFEVYASDGAHLGDLRVLAEGAEMPPQLSAAAGQDSIASMTGDWAVAALAPASPAAAARYAAFPGLPLAPSQAPVISWGMSGDGARPAAAPGYSGGPAVDARGFAHGIVSNALRMRDALSAPVPGMMAPDAPGRAGSRAAPEMTARQPALITPLSDPALLAALGRAGSGVRASPDAATLSGRTPLTLLGMPGGYCAATATVQGPLDRPMPDTIRRPPGAPSPYEVRVARDGTRLAYDGAGKLSRVLRPDGTVRDYADGKPLPPGPGDDADPPPGLSAAARGR